MPEDFIPLDNLKKILQLWWLPLLALLAGGLVGYAYHLSQPALYESQAVFTFSLDYPRLGKLSDAEEDQVMGAAGELMRSTRLVEALQVKAQAQQLVPPGFDFKNQLAVERKSYRWVLRVRNPDPQNAAKVAGLWSEMSLAALQDASRHAEQANTLQHQLDGLQNCLMHMAVTEPAAAQCAWPSQAALQSELSKLSSQFQAERTASQDLVVGLDFTLSQAPQAADQPVTSGRNTLMLAGGLLGFALGVFAASNNRVRGLFTKGSHAG